MTTVPKDVEVLTGPPGCGKSTRLREDAIRTPGLYVFFLPSIALIGEQVKAFRAEAPHVELHEAHSDKGRGSVQRDRSGPTAVPEHHVCVVLVVGEIVQPRLRI